MRFARSDGWGILGLLSLFAWALSLVLPMGGGYTGLDILSMGWLGLFLGNFGFLANLSVLFGPPLLVFRRKPRIWSSLALAILMAIPVYSAAVWDGMILGGNMNAVYLRPFGPAYYLWFLAIVAASFSPIVREAWLGLSARSR